MFILFLFLWIIFNGRFTIEILLTGALVSVLVSFLLYRLLGWSLARDRLLLYNLPLLILYVLNLVKEMLVSTFQVLRFIWSPGRKPEPVMVEFRSGLRGRFVNTLLANSITLTPGTFTVAHEDDRFVIHCLHPGFADGLEDSSFIKLLRRIRS